MDGIALIPLAALNAIFEIVVAFVAPESIYPKIVDLFVADFRARLVEHGEYDSVILRRFAPGAAVTSANRKAATN